MGDSFKINKNYTMKLHKGIISPNNNIITYIFDNSQYFQEIDEDKSDVIIEEKLADGIDFEIIN